MFKVCTVPLVSRIRYLYFLPSYPLSSISTSRSSIFHHVPPTFDFSRIVIISMIIFVFTFTFVMCSKNEKKKKKRHGGRHENQRRVRSEHRVAGEIYEIEERHRSSSSSSSHSAF